MTTGDTIVVVSSAVGSGARMIVRASGPDARTFAASIASDPLPDANCAGRSSLRFNNLTVPGWVYVFHGPRSYTGEDLVEFHLPGNALLSRMLLDTLIGNGARLADPGEFTARAYFNGRLDLTEAEGVAATIAAGSEMELRAARQLLAGELARRLKPVTDLVAETLALVEVGIDFSDEDVTFLSAAQVAERIGRADALLRDLLDQSSRFERLSHEPQVVLVGRPNAGKSTLLNALAGHERAVTSPVAGTTRDVLTAEVALARGIVRLTDAAGLDEMADAADGDDIATQMHRNALRAVESADVVVLVRDITDDRADPVLPRPADFVVRTKADLLSRDVQLDHLSVSVRTSIHLDSLRAELDQRAFGQPTAAGGASLALNARHVWAVSEAREALARAAERVGDGAAELVALELRETLDALGGVVGVVTPDDVLGRVFSAFCIGK